MEEQPDRMAEIPEREVVNMVENRMKVLFPRRHPERFDAFLFVLVVALTLASGTIIARYVICALILPFALVRLGYEYETYFRAYQQRREAAWDTLKSQLLLLLMSSNVIGYLLGDFEHLFAIIGLTGIYLWLERERRTG